MLQINQKGIRPHIRINGAWYVLEAENVGLVFPSKLSLEDWYRCQVVCNKGTINIILFKDNKKILDREWKIIQGNVPFPFKTEEKDSNPKIVIPFAINLEYGSVGFRNFGEEKALIKNLLVEKI